MIAPLRAVLILLLTLSAAALRAQSPGIHPGQAIIHLAPEASMADVEQAMDRDHFTIRPDFRLGPRSRRWLVRFDPTVDVDRAVKTFSGLDVVTDARPNQRIVLRDSVPDDAFYGSQWQYDNSGFGGGVPDADLDAPEAWDIATGGLTPLGDTIVVAVIDDGIDPDHPDLQGRLWVNRGEIPNNGIDDDGNGYIDDYRGWNVYDNDDDIEDGAFGGGHGTPVAGIIGAAGNNGTGVTGVNWNVKIMVIVGGGGQASAVASYRYALEQRRLYNRTNGEEGAYVVATNSSWGIDFGDPASAPLWCAMYDSLGKEGVTSAGATINDDQNVDVVGDLPTGCTSDHLISVTNVGRNDVKIGFAGYGEQSVDIGSFGQDAYTLETVFNGSYGGFGGTSGATPHVAGGVALLYSVDCPWFTCYDRVRPDSASLLAIDMTLSGADANATLDGITVTGGRQNLVNSLALLRDSCPTCCPVIDVRVTDNDPGATMVHWTPCQTDSVLYYSVEWSILGQDDWQSQPSVDTFATLSGLDPAIPYEVRVRTFCVAGDEVRPIVKTDFVTGANTGLRTALEAPTWTLAPNPARDRVVVFHPDASSWELEVIDALGRVVRQTTVIDDRTEWGVGNLPSGLYTVVLHAPTGVSSRRLIVR